MSLRSVLSSIYRKTNPESSRVSPKKAVRMTSKQWDVLTIIVNGNGEVEGNFIPVDLDQILERQSYISTKQSLQFILRSLVEKGLIEKGGMENRRDRQRRLYFPTTLGKQMFGTETDHSFVEKESAFSD